MHVERSFPKPNDYVTIATATYPEQIVALKKFLRKCVGWMNVNLVRVTP